MPRILRHSQSQQNQQDIISPPVDALTRIQGELSELARQLQDTNETAARAISGVTATLQVVIDLLQRR